MSPCQLPPSQERKYCGALVPVKNILKRGRGQDKALERGLFPCAFASVFCAND